MAVSICLRGFVCNVCHEDTFGSKRVALLRMAVSICLRGFVCNVCHEDTF